MPHGSTKRQHTATQTLTPLPTLLSLLAMAQWRHTVAINTAATPMAFNTAGSPSSAQ
ncbi:unnamed protein product, partial [Ilex paraguariensis]